MKVKHLTQEQLYNNGACKEAIKWVGGKSPLRAWTLCQRGDWLLWYVARNKIGDPRKLALAKGLILELVKDSIKADWIKTKMEKLIDYGTGTDIEPNVDLMNIDSFINLTWSSACAFQTVSWAAKLHSNSQWADKAVKFYFNRTALRLELVKIRDEVLNKAALIVRKLYKEEMLKHTKDLEFAEI